jgi:hypothetical protein
MLRRVTPETRENGERQPLLVFVHIRKTAGYSLRKILLEQYGGRNHVRLLRNFFTRPEESLEMVQTIAADPPEDLQVAHGHILFWPQIEWDDSVRFFTVLRDPVERTISHYYWIRARNPSFGMTLAEALAAGQIHDNLQTRVLAANDAPIGETPAEALDQAKASLDRFAVVGLTERFDETLALLTREFGWRRTLYERANVTRSRKPRDELDAETLALIERHNALDIELYRLAAERFDALMQRQPDDFRIEVEALQLANTRHAALEDGAEPDALAPSLRAAEGDALDMRALVVASQADVLVREYARRESAKQLHEVEKQFATANRKLQAIENKAERVEKKKTGQDLAVERLQAKLDQRNAELGTLKEQHAAQVARLEAKVADLRRTRRERREESGAAGAKPADPARKRKAKPKPKPKPKRKDPSRPSF